MIKPSAPIKSITYRKHTSIHKAAFRDDIALSTLASVPTATEAAELVNEYNIVLSKLGDEYNTVLSELVDEYNTVLSELVDEYNTVLSELVDEYNTVLSELVDEYNTVLSELVDEYNTVLSELVEKNAPTRSRRGRIVPPTGAMVQREALRYLMNTTTTRTQMATHFSPRTS